MLRCPQRQGEEDPGRIAWEKANPSTAPAGSVAMLRCPQRAPASNKRRLDWEDSLPQRAPAGNERRLDWEESLPQRAPAGSELRLDWEDRQYAGNTKFSHAMAVAGLSKRQRIDSDQAKRIVDARPSCPCREQTMKENKHVDMRVSARCASLTA